MNIQPSVLIWTVICFCVLMLVVDKLLFKPVLGFMHRRRQRIEDAEARRAEHLARQEQARLDREKALAEAGQAANERAAAAVAAATAAAHDAVAETKARLARQLEQDRAEMELQRRELNQSLDQQIPQLAAALARRLTT